MHTPWGVEPRKLEINGAQAVVRGRFLRKDGGLMQKAAAGTNGWRKIIKFRYDLHSCVEQ